MSDPLTIDLFAEDVGHERLLSAIVQRVVSKYGKLAALKIRSARGGHAKALGELRLYLRALEKGVVQTPGILIVAIDTNCAGFPAKRAEIADVLEGHPQMTCVVACPNPHIERWFMADRQAFESVIGPCPALGRVKCSKGEYKAKLAQAVAQAGYPSTLGGVEFADEIAEAMNFYWASKADHSLKAFLEELESAIRP